MLCKCAICQCIETKEILKLKKSPTHPFCPAQNMFFPKGFGNLKIVECSNCSHVYNSSFEINKVNDLYEYSIITNVSVSKSMEDDLKNLSNYILKSSSDNPVIADIGGGIGTLSRYLARGAKEVHLFEPCKAIKQSDFKGEKIILHQDMFPVKDVEIKFDVIIVKQVLEHVPNLQNFLFQLQRRLKDKGICYIEIPSFEYIEKNESIVDIYYPHIHYFRKNVILNFLESFGFKLLDFKLVKNGHDYGMLLSKCNPISFITPKSSKQRSNISEKLKIRIQNGLRTIYTFNKKKIALYGATAGGQILITLYPSLVKNIRYVFDDTPYKNKNYVYSSQKDIEIIRPSEELINQINIIIITAFLHDDLIAMRLKSLNFSGTIYTLKSPILKSNNTYNLNYLFE